MNYLDIQNRARGLVRDFSNSIFRQQDVQDYISEAIDRFRQYVPELSGMTYLVATTDVPSLLPSQYHSLIALFCAARLFEQDERNYQATQAMNEFETKLEELRGNIQSGIITITDSTGKAVTATYNTDLVVDDYFYDRNGLIPGETTQPEDVYDIDNGVEGLEEDGDSW